MARNWQCQNKHNWKPCFKVSSVTKSGCTLGWRAPQDDGGAPITNYTVESMDPKTGATVPCGQTDGLSYEVKNLKKGLFHFCVSAQNSEGTSEKLVGPQDPVHIKDPFEVPGAPKALKIAEGTDRY